MIQIGIVRLKLFSLTIIVLLNGAAASNAWAQAGLRDSLERLDTDQDGQIEPDEITSLARPYLERIASVRRMSLERPNPIEGYLEAARIYYAINNGVSGGSAEPEGASSIRSFRPEPDTPLIPEFGLAQVKYPYTLEDLEEADQTLRRSDRNRDGQIDREEAKRARWTHRDPFAMDLDQNERLSRLELAQRYARRRMLSGASDELIQKARRVGNGIASSRDRNGSEREDRSQWWRQGGSRYYLAASVLGRFDRNRNGRLESSETQALGIPVGLIDVNRDSELSRDELQAYLSEKQDEAGDTSEGLPGWFYELDANEDGQVEMAEFAQDWSDTTLLEFSRLDANEDGLLTAIEVSNSKAQVGGSFVNESAEVLPPRKTVISEIEVDEDFLVGDLNVKISLTHSHVSHLDAYLTGPAGQRIELFTEIGGGGDHFAETTFDDQSRYPIVKARPPYTGTFQPEGLSKKQPGLDQFRGKSALGVWQLVVRGTRSDRFGLLHNWALVFRPLESMGTDSNVTPAQDGPQTDGGNLIQRPSHLVPQSPAEFDAVAVAAPSGKAETTKDNYDQERRAKEEAFARLSPEEQAEKIARYKEWVAKQKEAYRKGDKATGDMMPNGKMRERAPQKQAFESKKKGKRP